MEEVVLVIHLILAVAIIILVLLQRSEGGGLGIGGSGGLGGFASARGTANALTRTTTFLAIGFFATSLTLGVLANMETSSAGLLERIGEEKVVAEEVVAAPVEKEAVAPISDVTDVVAEEVEGVTEEVSEAADEVQDAVEEVQEDIKEEVEAAPVAPVSE